MIHALATPRRVKRNRHRWRKTASGRQHYNYFRDYEPGTGRYVQSDPIGLAGGISTFGYVGSRPLDFIDPYGLWGFGLIGGGTAEGGVNYGGGATGAVGVGFFADGMNNAHLGAFASGGVISKGPTKETDWTIPARKPSAPGDGILGAFIGAGGGLYATNATCVDQLEGAARTSSLHFGTGPLQFSIQYTSGYVNNKHVWTGSLTFGPGVGASTSQYPTQTATTGQLHLIR